MSDNEKIAANFNRAAASYDQVAILQRTVGMRLLEHLEGLRLQPRTILDLGCGTGHFLGPLKQRYPKAQVIGIDIAYHMLKQALGKRRWWRRYYLVGATLQSSPFRPQQFDFIYANLVLHWSTDLNHALKELQCILKPEGLLLFSVVGPDTLKELRLSWATVDQRPHVHVFPDMHQVGDALLAAHFQEVVLDSEYFTLLYPDVYQLMSELKQLGVRNLSPARHRGLTGKASLQRLVQAYEDFRCDTTLPATWEIIYGHAWQSQGLTLPTGEVTIPITQIRRH